MRPRAGKHRLNHSDGQTKVPIRSVHLDLHQSMNLHRNRCSRSGRMSSNLDYLGSDLVDCRECYRHNHQSLDPAIELNLIQMHLLHSAHPIQNRYQTTHLSQCQCSLSGRLLKYRQSGHSHHLNLRNHPHLYPDLFYRSRLEACSQNHRCTMSSWL